MAKTATTPRILPFKIGGDPELLLFYGDKHINAGQAVPKFFEGKFTKSPNSMGYLVREHGSFGWDGASPTCEIRPKESDSIETLTKNIQELFVAAHETMPLFDMSTLSIGRPVGGHFHVDAPAEFMNDEKLLNKTKKIIAALLLPILASEHKLSSTQRTKGGGYGEISDIRVHTDFGTGTFELRGPSSEWLTSEKICRSTLAYIAVIWNEIIKNHVKLGKNEMVFKSLMQTKAMQDMIIADYKPLATMMTELVSKQVKTFELYPQYKEEVDFILDPKAVYKEKEAAGWNITNGWNLKNEKVAGKRDLLAKNKIKEKIKSMNIELFMTTFSIAYNDDYNVASFANAITERIAATNWNLTNEYFLFGLKKGTEGFLAGPAIQFTKTDGAKLCYTIPKNIAKADSIAALTNIAKRVQAETGNTVKINPKTGKAFAGVSNMILIGIPYDVRAEENIKALIDIMWDIENGKLKTKEIETFEVQVIANKDEKDVETMINAVVSKDQPQLSSEAQAMATTEIMESYQTEGGEPPEPEENEERCDDCGELPDDCSCDND